MKKGLVYLIGAGPGDPGLITVKALDAMTAADCIVYDYLANPVFVEQCECEKIYVGKSGSSHTLPQADINQLLVSKAREGKVVARLKGGDPFIFGRGGEEAEALAAAGIPFAVIPGISSFYSAPAYAGIPITHRDFANTFEVITGHRRTDASEGADVNLPEYAPDRTFAFLMGVKNLSHIITSLVKKKDFPAQTPVALISWGTRPEQQVVTGTLEDIVAKAHKADIRPPSIIVVGRVVSLREKLRWFDNQPLFGKTIVVTRTRSQASKLTRQLLTRGAGVIEFPTIEIQPMDDLGPLEHAIRNIKTYDWLLLTSQNAVKILFEKIFAMRLDARVLGPLRIAVIGPATGDELLRYGIRPDIVPSDYVAEGLLAALKDQDLAGRKVLLPCAEEARPVLADGIRAAGAAVDRIHIYKTVRPANIADETIAQVEKADMITFTSSSTARNFFALVPASGAQLASIGPVTSQAIRDCGFEPEIEARQYTIDGLVQAIVEQQTCLA